MSDKQAVDDLKALDVQAAPQSKAERERGDAAASYKNTKTAKTSMAVRVRSPFRIYYDGQAFSLSAENGTGPFDILPGHHNFICLLLPCELIVRTVSGEEQKFLISGGMMHVKTDQVIVFLDI